MGLVVVNILLLVTTIVLMAVSGGYATSAAKDVTDIPKYTANTDLKNAHRYLSIAAVITWITLPVLLIITVIQGFILVFGTVGRVIFYIFISLILLTILIIGILSAAAAADIKKSKVTDDKGSRKKAIIAAILAIVGFFLIVFALIGEVIERHKKKESGGLKDQLSNFDYEDFKKLTPQQKAKELEKLGEEVGETGVKTVEADPEVLAV